MWVGYKDALAYYVNEMIREWKKRGYNNSMEFIKHKKSFDLPPFVGLKRFHSIHPYFWPSEINKSTDIVTHVNGETHKMLFK